MIYVNQSVLRTIRYFNIMAVGAYGIYISPNSMSQILIYPHMCVCVCAQACVCVCVSLH